MEIYYETPDLANEVSILAQHYHFDEKGLLDVSILTQEVLALTHEGLMVYAPNAKPWQIDFLSSARQHRRKYGGSEVIARACGIKKNKEPLTIIDATAGYGKDGFVLACLGAKVILVERHPVMAALLEDALKRFYKNEISENITLKLCFSDTQDFLKNQLNNFLPELPDVIYWDPMHPERQKSALVKKDMALLQRWTKPEMEPEELIKFSLPYAKDRVVLKWPKKAAALNNLKPNFVYEENTVRFEVFKKHVKTMAKVKRISCDFLGTVIRSTPLTEL
jgi:16S rRNA (guanine1516-N2)-methyltransferase